MARGNVTLVEWENLSDEQKKQYQEGARYEEFCSRYNSSVTSGSNIRKEEVKKSVYRGYGEDFSGAEYVFNFDDTEVSAKSKMKLICYQKYEERHSLEKMVAETDNKGNLIVDEQGKANVIKSVIYAPKDPKKKIYVDENGIPSKYSALKKFKEKNKLDK